MTRHAPLPPSAREYARKGASAQRREFSSRQCSKCLLWWRNLRRHEAACNPQEPAKYDRVPQGHRLCATPGCDRIVALHARTCIRCNGTVAAIAEIMGERAL